jgi:hypothetical protein
MLDQDPIAPSEPVFKQLGWMSIEQRIKYHQYLLVSKCLKNEAPVYLKNKIQYLSARNPYSLRNVFQNGCRCHGNGQNAKKMINTKMIIAGYSPNRN